MSTGYSGYWFTAPLPTLGGGEPPKPAKPKKPGVPWAHIRAGGVYGNDFALCRATLFPNDFVFEDRQRALEVHGPDNKYLQACSSCLDEVRRKG